MSTKKYHFLRASIPDDDFRLFNRIKEAHRDRTGLILSNAKLFSEGAKLLALVYGISPHEPNTDPTA